MKRIENGSSVRVDKGARLYELASKKGYPSPKRFTEKGTASAPFVALVVDHAGTKDWKVRPELYIVRLADMSMIGVEATHCAKVSN